MDKKDRMLSFIKEKNSKYKVREVLEIKLKDYDDEDGAIGEHYIVDCIILKSDPEENLSPYNPFEVQCLVNKVEFDSWNTEIKWLPFDINTARR
jgi:hypothetical protein